ncbi:tonB dependent receptor domain-containing protein [Ditylenchus destructor]|nr:tonB dependent receptor domain-containing protein [Ditylenchus destructor]
MRPMRPAPPRPLPRRRRPHPRPRRAPEHSASYASTARPRPRAQPHPHHDGGADRRGHRPRHHATDAEDALKYLPSLLVRKRYIGDYNHAVLSTRASGTGNSARSLVYADGILLSNLLGNGATYAPRWGLVSPEEISRVDVIPACRHASRLMRGWATAISPRAFLGGDRSYDAQQASASIGSADGAFSWWLHVGRTDSEGPPQTFATKLLSSGAPVVDGKVGGVTAIPVSGAVQALNRSNQPWLMVGSGTQYDTVQDQAKVKLAYDLDAGLRAMYVFGLWSNRSDGSSRSFLTDAKGQTVDHRSTGGLSQPVIIDGKGYTLGASDFPQTRDELEHRMHAVSLKRRVRDGLGWELSGSLYDYQSDRSRAYAPTVATLPQAGRLTDQGGTGALSAADAGVRARRLAARRAWSADLALRRDTQLRSVFAQDAWAFAPDWTAVLGLRGERWQAFDGITQSGVNTLLHPLRAQTAWSPKAALSYGLGEHWVLKASTGRAVRFPTVSELYQGGFNAKGEAINNNPDLKPERGWTSELSAEGPPGCAVLAAQRRDEREHGAEHRSHPDARGGAQRHGDGAAALDGDGQRDFRGFGNPGECGLCDGARRHGGQMAAARAALAGDAAHAVAGDRCAQSERGRALQRAAVQHAGQQRSERIRVHEREQVLQRRCARAVEDRSPMGARGRRRQPQQLPLLELPSVPGRTFQLEVRWDY